MGCCEHYEIEMPLSPFQCTVQVARKHFGIRPAKLNNVCSVLGIELNHHEALSDARACAKILMHKYQDELRALEEARILAEWAQNEQVLQQTDK